MENREVGNKETEKINKKNKITKRKQNRSVRNGKHAPIGYPLLSLSIACFLAN